LIIIHVLIITYVTDNYSYINNSPYTDIDPYNGNFHNLKWHLKMSFFGSVPSY